MFILKNFLILLKNALIFSGNNFDKIVCEFTKITKFYIRVYLYNILQVVQEMIHSKFQLMEKFESVEQGLGMRRTQIPRKHQICWESDVCVPDTKHLVCTLEV